MSQQSPYKILKRRHVTEKAATLEQLKDSESNPSVRACNQAKYTFEVDGNANKVEIAKAVEAVYSVKVDKVNTINVKQKPGRLLKTRRGRGKKASFKKAIVTLQPNETLEI